LIEYGVELWIFFPKTGFSKNNEEIKRLFYYRSFNEAQKKVKCKVLVNYNETREISLGEFIQFMDEVSKGKHSQYDIPIQFGYLQLTQETRKIIINSFWRFTRFLSYLYCTYRKIEMKMEEVGYPDVLPDLDSNEKSFMKICLNLDKAKEDYKSMNRDDFLKMYPILKKFFFTYIDYIKYSIEHMNDIDEGDHILENIKEMKSFLEKLNKWSPIKVND